METNATKSPFLDETDRWCDVTNKTSATIKALWEGDVVHCSGSFWRQNNSVCSAVRRAALLHWTARLLAYVW